MSSKRKSPPTKFTPDDLNNGMHRTPADLLDKDYSKHFNPSPIPEVEESALNTTQDSCDDSDDRQQPYFDDEEEEDEEEEENFLDNMSSPVASDSCSPYPSRLADPDSDSVVSDAEGRLEGCASNVNQTIPAFYHRKQRLLQSVSSGKSRQSGETDSDSDAGCYSGSECGGLSSTADQRLISPGQSTSGDAGCRPANRRSMDDVLKKLTSKMNTSATLSENSSYGHYSNRKQANG